MLQLTVYVFSLIIVLYSLDSVNIGVIFKKNQIVKARIFYCVLALCLTYLLGSMIYSLAMIKL